MKKISERVLENSKYKICRFEDGNFFLATNDDIERILMAWGDESELMNNADEIIKRYEKGFVK